MKIKRLFQKAFVGGQWYVAYRRKGEDEYAVINVPEGMWIADPMLFEADGEHYIFVEVYEKCKKKAGIGYYHFEKGKPVYKGMIIENSYHMSYPCVFKYQEEYYMIPESSANNTIDLYRAESFPDKWVKDTTLIDGEKYVDTTVIMDKGNIYLLSYKVSNGKWKLVQFILNMNDRIVKEVGCKQYKENIARPAGYLFDNDGLAYRPAQDCRVKYGEQLILYRVESINPFCEKTDSTVSISDINANIKADRIHTYSTDGSYEVVDLFSEKIDLLHGIKIFCRAYFRK